MKAKLLIPALSILFVVSVAKAQPYAGVTIGYGMPGTWSVLGTNYESNGPANTFSSENVVGSYGTGLNFGGYVGGMVSDNTGFELGINYLVGAKYSFRDYETHPNTTDNIDDKVYARSLRLCPSLRVTFGDKNIRPYTRAGIVIGIMNKINDDLTETFTTPGTTDITLETFELRKGLAVGFTGALGINIPLNTNMFFFA